MSRPHTLGAWWLSICGAASALLIVGSAAYTAYEQRDRLVDLAIRAVSRKGPRSAAPTLRAPRTDLRITPMSLTRGSHWGQTIRARTGAPAMEDVTITSESPYLVTGTSSSDGTSREIAASVPLPTITISGENVRLTNR